MKPRPDDLVRVGIRGDVEERIHRKFRTSRRTLCGLDAPARGCVRVDVPNTAVACLECEDWIAPFLPDALALANPDED